MKNTILLMLSLCTLYSCKKHNDNIAPMPPNASDITKDTISGFVKGTMASGKTYYVSGDVYVKSTDTLVIKPGVTVKLLGDPNAAIPKSYTIHVSGTLMCNGTKTEQISMLPANPNPQWGVGYWGGIHCDSAAKVVNLSWTNISYTGGPDVSGGSQFAFSVVGVGPATNNTYTSSTKVVVENCSFTNGIDDGIRLMGPIQVSIKGNVMRRQGYDDGDNINVKNGVMGDIAYNYIWSSANNSIKLMSNVLVLVPETKMNIYNNTIVSGGWRKQGETTSGILVDAYAGASVYNNLIVNTQRGIRITQAADTSYIKKVGYGNNFFYTTADSTVKYFYPTTDWGRKQSGDILSTGSGNNNPNFMMFDTNYNASTDMNDAHLKNGSPAIGKGNTNAPFSNLSFGTVMHPGKDIGCYQTDGSGNQR